MSSRARGEFTSRGDRRLVIFRRNPYLLDPVLGEFSWHSTEMEGGVGITIKGSAVDLPVAVYSAQMNQNSNPEMIL